MTSLQQWSCIAIRIALLLSLSATVNTGRAQDSQTRSSNDPELQRSWLQNMAWHHRFTAAEMRQVTGLSEAALEEQLQQLGPRPSQQQLRPQNRVHVLPYPGGRHPRIGFLDGAYH